MDIISIILIAVGLAMDCFAVSIAQGFYSDIRDIKEYPHFLLMASLFGLFQGGMPLISYFFGGWLFPAFFKHFAPWVSLALLGYIGGKMIVESLRKKEVQDTNWQLLYVFMLAIATSIDAFATGLIFIPVPERLWLGVSVIALVSFLFSFLGIAIGSVFGKKFKLNVELIGGIILVGIGLKIWIQGVCF